MKNCFKCGEKLDEIMTSDGPTTSHIWINVFDEKAGLYVCTSRDCANVGIVICIPAQAKED